MPEPIQPAGATALASNLSANPTPPPPPDLPEVDWRAQVAQRSPRAAAARNFAALDNLRGGRWNSWKPILKGALPASLVGGGLAYLGDRLLSGKPEDDEEASRQKWRRGLLTSLGLLGGGYLGGSKAWKNQTPGLDQSLALSLAYPEEAFARGMHENYASNMRRAGRDLKGVPTQDTFKEHALEGLSSGLETVTDKLPLSEWLTPSWHLDTWMRPLMGSQPDETARAYRHNRGIPASPGRENLRQQYNMAAIDRMTPALEGAMASGDEETAEALRHQMLPYLTRLLELQDS